MNKEQLEKKYPSKEFGKVEVSNSFGMFALENNHILAEGRVYNLKEAEAFSKDLQAAIEYCRNNH